MSEDIHDRIAAFFAELELMPDKPRGARAMLAPYARQMRMALGRKLNRQELLESLRSRGLSISPAMLREILKTVPDEPDEPLVQKVTRKKTSTSRSRQSSSATANGPAAATGPSTSSIQGSATALMPDNGTPLTAKTTDASSDESDGGVESGGNPFEFL